MRPYYQDDAVTIYHGDCREILPTLEPVDLVLTDPPYNVSLDYCDGDSRDDYEEWCSAWFAVCPRPLVFTPGVVNVPMWYSIETPTWVGAWVKSNQNSGSSIGGFSTWEPIFFYGKPPRRVPHDSWIAPIALSHDTGDHPCPKHLPTWRAILANCSEAGLSILDPFMGSGTTLRAAKDLGRKAIGIEIEERYCEIAAKRMAQEVLFP